MSGAPGDRPRPPVEEVVAEDLDFPPRGAPRGPVDLSGVDLVMLGHAHIDLGYRWDIQETVHRIAPDTFRGVLAVMDRTPGFTFCQSQMFLYAAMERHEPELYRRIREAIREGRWEVVGGAWCEYDATLPSGESVIRQHLQGMRYAADRLGVTDNEIGFVPDSFIAHAATLPQILAGCGIRFYLFCRGLPAGSRRAFRWEGPDGSSVVAYIPFGPYANPPLTPTYLESLKPYAEASVASTELALYGLGDHGGGPREADITALAALRGIASAPQWRYGTAGEFFRTVFPEDAKAALPAHRGSLRSFATGALTSQAQAKRDNRMCEHLLLETEAIASLATTLQRKPAHPRVDFSLLWRELLTQQFHDILPGTSVAAVYRQARDAYRRVREGAELLRGDALDRIGSRLDTTGAGYPLLVVNASLGAAGGVVQAAFPPWLPMGVPLELRDHRGSPVEAAWCPTSVAFAAALDALSYRLYRVHEGRNAPPEPTSPAPVSGRPVTELTRGGTTVRFDPETGDPVAIETGGRLVAARAFSLELWQEEEKSTSWVYAPTGRLLPVTLAEGPQVVLEDRFRTVVRTVSRSAWSSVTRELTLSHDTGRLELRVLLDWHDCDALLKLRVSPPAQNGAHTVRASLPHGFEIVVDPSREFCMQDWVDLHDGVEGLALLTDGAYGADVTERGLGVSVIRSARDMDPSMGHGEHELRLALVPYRGEFRQSRLVRARGGFVATLHARWETAHGGALMSWGAIDSGTSLPPEGRFVSVDRENVEICAVKLPEEHYTPDSLVVRLRELDGERCTCVLRLPLPVRAAWTADHLERPLRCMDDATEGASGKEIRIALAPREIRTLIAYF